MRLKTKLVFTATGLTFAIVLTVSILFLGELLRQRVAQTAASNEVLAQQVLMMTRLAVETGLRASPPIDSSDESLHAAVTDALRSSIPLSDVMNGVVRYSPTVQDVSVTDAHGLTLVSTDPDMLNLPANYRTPFVRVQEGSLTYQVTQVFGKPRVLDISAPLDRNGMHFLVVHLGVRSTFLRNSYEPWLRTALWLALVAALASMAAAALFSSVALRPLKTISEQLERLTLSANRSGANLVYVDQPLPELTNGAPFLEPPKLLPDAAVDRIDAISRVNRTIDLLGRQIRSTEEGYTALQANLDQMLDTLRDGVLLFTAGRRAVMVSDAVAHFVPRIDAKPVTSLVGRQLEEIFIPGTALGNALRDAFNSNRQVSAQMVTMEDGRQVQISLDRIDEGRGGDRNGGLPREMGTLLTLRDTGSALELEQELEVARRLAAIGRLTAGVGHEVKNPINAMVVHLELLRSKLAANGDGKETPFDRQGARRHVDILADEMHRLDRVVQTLADFSRPMELNLREQDLRSIIQQVIDLSGAEMKQNGVHIEADVPAAPIPVRADAELIRQAMLNLLLNGMQAMPNGGSIHISLRREQRMVLIEIADTGEGIPSQLLPRIFELYFTTKPTGSGIGLAMTYRILQLHGGRMDVRSDADPASPNRGTTFTLCLPISAGPASSPTVLGSLAHGAVAGPANKMEREDAAEPHSQRKVV